MIIIAIIFIAVISIALAFFSLHNLRKGISTEETQKELEKERVIFHSSDAL